MASVAITPWRATRPGTPRTAELAAFVLLLFLLVIRHPADQPGAMTARQDAIRAEFAELDEAKSEGKAEVRSSSQIGRRAPRGRADPRGGAAGL